MPLFAVLCLDKPGMVERRNAVRAEARAQMKALIEAGHDPRPRRQ